MLKLIEMFPLLAEHTATIFRYHRWDKSLFFRVYLGSTEKFYLIFKPCSFFEFDRNLVLDRVTIIKKEPGLIIQDKPVNFLVKCSSVELWTCQQYRDYNNELYMKLSDEKRYGIRKAINSLE